jgi:orotidine-5'-phosphate decarboxylase
MSNLIKGNKTVIVAVDTTKDSEFTKLVNATAKIPGIGAYKLGVLMGLGGLEWAADFIASFNENIPIIYDHQKGGNDIPEMGGPLARKLKESGIDAVILFPFAGPKTQTEWTKACQGEGLTVLTGGIMTHQNFLAIEGGYIADDAPERIIKLAIELGVTDFIAPGTKIPWVEKIRGWAEEALGKGNFTISAPGFVKQGGVLSDCAKVAGDRWHAIIGSAIYNKPTTKEMRSAAESFTAGMTA